MAQTIIANASASLSANGTNTAPGSITWSAPVLPDGVSTWDDVRVSGSWSWGGKGNISRVTINGTNTSADAPFDISIVGKPSPLSISCVGNNRNATGANFRWSDLAVTYIYTPPVTDKNTLYVQLNGAPVEVATIYRKTNGVWIEVAPESLDPNAKYVNGNL